MLHSDDIDARLDEPCGKRVAQVVKTFRERTPRNGFAGEIVWHPVFLDFARYWGFAPRLCGPYRAQTKGKVEAGVKYVRRNFLCGLQGREPDSLSDLNAQLREWIWGVANQRVHGTTHEQVLVRWDVERFSLQSLAGQPPYPYVDGELRKVARDAYVDWQGSRCSVPWQYAGQDVWVQEIAGEVDIRTGRERIAMHGKARRKHRVLTFPPHPRRLVPLPDAASGP